MLLDAREVPRNSILETDICIIGGGIAGLTIAQEFIIKESNTSVKHNRQTRVMILESGGEEIDERTQELYSGKFQIRDFTGQTISRDSYLTSSRSRRLGGSGNHWGGRCLILDDIDFEKRDWLPYSGWPFSKKELNPYYNRACDLLQIPNYDYNIYKNRSPYIIGDNSKVTTKMMHYSPLAARNGDQYDSFKKKVADSKKIKVYLYANVTQILTNKNDNKVSRVRVQCLPIGENRNKVENSFQVKAKKFILATGGIENARLLLLSNQKYKNGLGNRNGLVGRFFMEHLWFSDKTHIYFSRQKDLRFYEEDSEKIYTQKQTKRGILSLNKKTQEQNKLLNFLGEISLTRREGSDLFRSFIRNIYDTDNLMHIKEKKDFFDGHLRGLRVAGGEKSPDPRSRLTLGSERDLLGQKKVNLSMQINKRDYEYIEKTLQIIGQELGKAGEGRVRWPGFISQPDQQKKKKQIAELLQTVGLPSHHMGTTRMHTDPRYGVVDENCLVHGISNLYVAGSSVFPTCGFANPTLTLTALAIRLADYIKTKI
ncbi:MAG: GMC family oxidoreductase [Leptospirales bacterium]